MSAEQAGGTPKAGRRLFDTELIPREYLRVIAVWSLIPSYMFAGAVIGYFLDRWLGWFPYLTAGGLLLALLVATRDMMRLKDMMGGGKS